MLARHTEVDTRRALLPFFLLQFYYLSPEEGTFILKQPNEVEQVQVYHRTLVLNVCCTCIFYNSGNVWLTIGTLLLWVPFHIIVLTNT